MMKRSSVRAETVSAAPPEPVKEAEPPAPVYETRVLACDSVVVSGGRKPRDPGAFADCAPIFKKIGDSVKVGNIQPATYSGYKAAMEL